MCFVVVGTFEPKRNKKKSKVQSTKDTLETFNYIMNTDNSISRIFKQLESYMPKSMFQRISLLEVYSKFSFRI